MCGQRLVQTRDKRSQPAYLSVKQGTCPNVHSNLCKQQILGSGEPAQLALTAVILD